MSEGTTRVALGLGSNLGDRLAALQGGVDGWAGVAATRAVAVSGVYESAAVGGPKQPDYLNAVMIIETGLPAEQVLDIAQGTEHRWRRHRTVRWGPRTLDIDILSYGTTTLESERLTLPHPRAAQRWFVMLPWAELDSDCVLPNLDQSVASQTCSFLGHQLTDHSTHNPDHLSNSDQSEVSQTATTVGSALATLRLADPAGERACVKRSDLALRLPEPNTLRP